MRSPTLRFSGLILTVMVFVSAVLLGAPADAAAQTSRDAAAESGFLASLNQQRAAAGLRPLAFQASMTNAAAGWTRQMVDGSFLAHASDIVGGTPGGWTKVGENVGRGQTVTSLTQAFMNSPSHRANVMDPSYTHIGIAVIPHPTDGRIYTTHRFAALAGSTTANSAPVAAAPPAAAPTPAPPTPIPVPAAPAAIPPTPPAVLPTPTAVPPNPTPVPPTPTPAPTPTRVAIAAEFAIEPPAPGPTVIDLASPPEQLAFLDDSTAAAAAEKHRAKAAKAARGIALFASRPAAE